LPPGKRREKFASVVVEHHLHKGREQTDRRPCPNKVRPTKRTREVSWLGEHLHSA
jgi:hypothetical protein